MRLGARAEHYCSTNLRPSACTCRIVIAEGPRYTTPSPSACEHVCACARCRRVEPLRTRPGWIPCRTCPACLPLHRCLRSGNRAHHLQHARKHFARPGRARRAGHTSATLLASRAVCIRHLAWRQRTVALNFPRACGAPPRESVVYWYSFSNPRTRCIRTDALARESASACLPHACHTAGPCWQVPRMHEEAEAFARAHARLTALVLAARDEDHGGACHGRI